LPVVVWIHGGGFVGGDKNELGGYLKLIASKGYVVAAPNYALAPAHHYPLPTRQVMAALKHVQAHAAEYNADVHRIAIAGDSAGAHVAAQISALTTTPGYSDAVGIAPAIEPSQLRAVVLCCGVFDMALTNRASSRAGTDFSKTVVWAYSGKRNALKDPTFATASVSGYVTEAFPPTLITVGNVDPLREHSQVMLERLRTAGRNPDAVFFPVDYQPPLDHEYQFNLDSEEGQLFFGRLVGFLERWLRPS
jgi:acetyl esterase/lipase